MDFPYLDIPGKRKAQKKIRKRFHFLLHDGIKGVILTIMERDVPLFWCWNSTKMTAAFTFQIFQRA